MARKKYDDDDGHVVANMNVEGMPWHRQGPKDETPSSLNEQNMATPRETWQIMLNAMKWVFIGSVAFVLVIVAFVWLLTIVWS